MRDDGDFAAYTAARWPSMVRSLVLLGCPRPEAEAAARGGLAHCYRVWDRLRRSDDPDVFLYRTVLAARDKASDSARDSARDEDRRRPPDDPDEESTEAVLMRRALEAELDRLDPEGRTVVVLRFVSDLSDDRVAEVLDVPIETVEDRVAEALATMNLDAVREAGR